VGPSHHARRLRLAHGRPRQVARGLLHERREVGIDGELGPVAVDRRREEQHPTLADLGLDQRGRATLEPEQGAAAFGIGRGGEQHEPVEGRLAQDRVFGKHGQHGMAAIDATQPLGRPLALEPALALGPALGRDRARALERLRQEVPERGLVGIGVDVLADRDEQAAPGLDESAQRGHRSRGRRLGVAKEDDVVVRELLGQPVGRHALHFQL